MKKSLLILIPAILFSLQRTSAESTNNLPTNTALSYILSTNDVSFFSRGAVRFTLSGSQKLLKVRIPKYDFSKYSVKIRLTNITKKSFDLVFRSFEPRNPTIPSLVLTLVSNNQTNTSLTPLIALKNSHPITNKIPSPAPPENIFIIRDWMLISLILLPLILGLAGYFIYRRIKNRPTTLERKRKSQDPFENIKQELERIHLSPDSDFRAVYEELSRITRYLIEAGLDINAPELATSEILHALKDKTPAHEVIVLIEHILKQCDRVLYAKHIAGFEQVYISYSEDYELLYLLAENDPKIIHPMEKLRLQLENSTSNGNTENKPQDLIPANELTALLNEIYHVDLTTLDDEKRIKTIRLIENTGKLREVLIAWFADKSSGEKKKKLIELLSLYKTPTEVNS